MSSFISTSSMSPTISRPYWVFEDDGVQHFTFAEYFQWVDGGKRRVAVCGKKMVFYAGENHPAKGPICEKCAGVYTQWELEGKER